MLGVGTYKAVLRQVRRVWCYEKGMCVLLEPASLAYILPSTNPGVPVCDWADGCCGIGLATVALASMGQAVKLAFDKSDKLVRGLEYPRCAFLAMLQCLWWSRPSIATLECSPEIPYMLAGEFLQELEASLKTIGYEMAWRITNIASCRPISSKR